MKRTVYACSTDWEYHLDGDPDGCRVFPTVEALMECMTCVDPDNKDEGHGCHVVAIECEVKEEQK